MDELRPHVITSQDAEGEELHALSSQEKAFQEDWLQEILFKHPSILPVDFVDEAFAPLIPIGREIASTDDLFISPSGLLTIVETKLWRNPEAHRTVIAQVLDYTNTLTTWSYRKLDEAVQSFMQKRYGKPISLFTAIKDRTKLFDLGEMEFRQRVQDTLINGRFALLIVGDRIYPSATQLAELIQSAPHLQFSMAFIELLCYRLKKDSEWPLIVFPRIVAKTKEETRAVVKVVYEEKKPSVEVTAPAEKEVASGHTSFPDFISSLPSNLGEIFQPYIEKWMKDGYTVYWGTIGFSLRINWGKKNRKITIFDAYPDWSAGILTEKWAQEYGLPEGPYREYRNALMKSPAIGSLIASGKRYVRYDKLADSDLKLLLEATDALAQSLSNAAASQRSGT